MEFQNDNQSTANGKCENCGYVLLDSNSFCPWCGKQVEREQNIDGFVVTTSQETNGNGKKLPKWPFIMSGIIIVIYLISIISSSVCFHSWVDANCTSPKTCKKCGETEGKELGHKWSEITCAAPSVCEICKQTNSYTKPHTVSSWKTVVKPTCAKEGTKEGKCSACNQTVTEKISTTAHIPGKWVVTKQATATTKGERAQKCSSCGYVIKTEEFSLTAAEIKKQYKSKCSKYSYNEISRNPDKYNGKYAVFTGEVIQVQQEVIGSLIFYVLRVNVTKTGTYSTYYTDTIYVTYTASENDARILEDDIVTMYGELMGEKTYTTIFGSSVTIPEFSAEYIDIK